MEVRVGHITHYFSHLGVAGVEIESDAINVGDMIHVRGHTTDFTQPVESIELENEHIDRAEPGQNVGIKVREHARENDWVMKIVTD